MALLLGEACDDKSSYGSAGYTRVNEANPASAAGTIDTCQIYARAANNISGLEYAVFTDNGSNSLTCQAGHHTNGSNLSATGGECTTHTSAGLDFTAFSVDSGEYIGEFHSSGHIEYGTGLSGMWYIESDEIFDDNTDTFSNVGNGGCSLRATGTEAGAGAAPTGGLYGSLVGPFGGPMGPMGGRL